jgi:phage-related protein
LDSHSTWRRLAGSTSRQSRSKGFGSAGVLEVIEDWDRSTYRAVYTVRFENAVFLLHVFQKKSKRGSATPKPDIDLIRERLKVAEQIAKERSR